MALWRARRLLVFLTALGVVGLALPGAVRRGVEPASAATPPIVRYFRVGVISSGQIKSTYVGNEQAVRYRGTQVFSWHFHALEIYEYRDYGSFSSASLSQACYGRGRSTCSPAKIFARLKEAANLREFADPNARTGGKTIACSRSDRVPKGDNDGYVVRRFDGIVGFESLESGFGALSGDLRGVLPKSMLEDKCWDGLGQHWISVLEKTGEFNRECKGGIAPDEATGAYEQTFRVQKQPVLRAFRKGDDISFERACSSSLGLDHESYASHEHTTNWKSTWSVNFQPLKESQLEGAIKQLKKQK